MFWMSFFKMPASFCSSHSAMTYRIEVHDDDNYDRGGWTMRKVMSKEEDQWMDCLLAGSTQKWFCTVRDGVIRGESSRKYREGKKTLARFCNRWKIYRQCQDLEFKKFYYISIVHYNIFRDILSHFPLHPSPSLCHHHYYHLNVDIALSIIITTYLFSPSYSTVVFVINRHHLL